MNPGREVSQGEGPIRKLQGMHHPREMGKVSGEQGGRVQRGNEVIALEVSAIEGKNGFHSVDAHNGDKPSYMASRLTASSDRGGVGRWRADHASNAAARSSGD